MFRQFVIGTAVACALTFAAPVGTFAQGSDAKQDAEKAKREAKEASKDAKEAGKEAKEAGKDAGEAAKDAGKATGKATKSAAKKTGQVAEDAAKETADGAKKAAKAVKKAVTPGPTSATCNDGTVQRGKTKTTACADHGGVDKATLAAVTEHGSGGSSTASNPSTIRTMPSMTNASQCW